MESLPIGQEALPISAESIVGGSVNEFKYPPSLEDPNAIRPKDTNPEDQSDDNSADGNISKLTDSNFDSRSLRSSATSSIPPRADEWDRTLRHIGLSDFGKALENAARAIYPNKTGSKYSRVYVLLISWQTEDPKLPVGREIKALHEVFEDVYHYDVEEFRIPDSASHAAVSEKINSFVKVNDDSSNDLKIVYYAGHSLLSRNKELVWSTLGEQTNKKYPKVVWSGIQRSLEMAQSDILILLDCCWSGVANDTEGNGITELVCACPFDARANGVGHYSFTQALTTELRLLSKVPSFSVGKLYTAIYTRMQSFLIQGIDNERYPPPVHFVLSQDGPLIRGIQLSVLESQAPDFSERGSLKKIRFEDEGSRKRLRESDFPLVPNKRANVNSISSLATEEAFRQSLDEAGDQHSQGSGRCNQQPTPYEEVSSCEQVEGTDQEQRLKNNFSNCIPKDSLYSHDAPRALFAVRFREDMRGEDLSVELFRDWLRSVPAAVEEVCVEASFKCFSTLVLITVPLSMSCYMLQHPAVFPLGAVKSSVILPSNPRNRDSRQNDKTTIMPPVLQINAEDKSKPPPLPVYESVSTSRDKCLSSTPRHQKSDQNSSHDSIVGRNVMTDSIKHSQQTQHLAPISTYGYPDSASRQSTNPIALQGSIWTLLTIEMQIVRTSQKFRDTVVMQPMVPKTLQEIVSSNDRKKVRRLQTSFEKRRRESEPHHNMSKDEEYRVIQSLEFGPDIEMGTDHQDIFTFLGCDGQQRAFPVRLSLAKKGSTYFIVLVL